MKIQKLLDATSKRRLRSWEPVKPATNIAKEQWSATLERCCILGELEVSVGEWVKEASKALSSKDLELCKYMALSNAQDEDKHELQISYLREYVVGKKRSVFQDGADEIIAMWQLLPASFTTAYALESGVFFTILPYLNTYGDSFCSRVSQWISEDETFHVLFNGTMSEMLGEKLTTAHVEAVVKTLFWLFQDDVSEAEKACQRAIRRFKTGYDQNMISEATPTGIAFFEQKSRNQIVY